MPPSPPSALGSWPRQVFWRRLEYGSTQLADTNGEVHAYIGGDGRGGVAVTLLDPSGKQVVMDESGVRSVKTGE